LDLSAASGNIDYPFIQKLYDSLAASYCIDKDKVFGFGYSQGGFIVELMACFGPRVFTAITSNSGGLFIPPGENGSYTSAGLVKCPNPAPSVMIIHGINDVVVNYQDNGIYARDSWLAMNKCKKTTTAFDPSPCVLYSECATGSVAFCPVNMTHKLWTSAATASWNYFSAQGD
jgi:polyhydroxybutyrate depolymerase